MLFIGTIFGFWSCYWCLYEILSTFHVILPSTVCLCRQKFEDFMLNFELSWRIIESWTKFSMFCLKMSSNDSNVAFSLTVCTSFYDLNISRIKVFCDSERKFEFFEEKLKFPQISLHLLTKIVFSAQIIPEVCNIHSFFWFWT